MTTRGDCYVVCQVPLQIAKQPVSGSAICNGVPLARPEFKMKNRETKTPKVRCTAMKSLRINHPKAFPEAQFSKQIRRLKCDERVVSGDFIANEDGKFELWKGPGGFRADAFLKPIYRRKKGSNRY
jgi:hypothetical protein